MEICKRTTTIYLEAPDFNTAFEKAKTAQYGENDFNVDSVESFPIGIKEHHDIPDRIDGFMADVMHHLNSNEVEAKCEGIKFENGATPVWTIRFNDKRQFSTIVFTNNWEFVDGVFYHGHCALIRDLKVNPLNATVLAKLLK